jgi:hypothetical protein
MMCVIEESPDLRLQRRLLYLQQIEQLYQQIQTWAKGKFNVVVPRSTYLMNDVTGDDDYQVSRLSVFQKDSLNENDTLLDFLPRGITFLSGIGVVAVEGHYSDDEVVYMQKDTVRYTERNGKRCLMYEGFVEDGWYLVVRGDDPSTVQRLTEAEFLQLVKKGEGLSLGGRL